MGIFNGWSRQRQKNFRPVSTTSALCESLKRTVRKHKSELLVDRSAISATSWIHDRKALPYKSHDFPDQAAKRSREGHGVDLRHMEISKAFDSVDHDHSDHTVNALRIKGRVNK